MAYGQDIVLVVATMRFANVDGLLDEPPVSLQIAELGHLIEKVTVIADLLGIQEVEGALRLAPVVLDLPVSLEARLIQVHLNLGKQILQRDGHLLHLRNARELRVHEDFHGLLDGAQLVIAQTIEHLRTRLRTRRTTKIPV